MTDDPEHIDLNDLLVLPRPRNVRRLPRLLAQAFRLVHAAAPTQLRTSVVLQLVGAALLGAQVLCMQALLERVVQLGGGDVEVVDALPWVIAVAAILTLTSFVGLVRVEVQTLLGEYVARFAGDQVLDAATRVPLIQFESPDFHNRLTRARVNASLRPAQMVNGSLGVLSSIVGLAGISVAIAAIEPVFLLVLVGAYLPLWLVTARTSRLSHRFSIEQTERDRRREYLGMVLSRKEEAGEVRAFGLAGPLRARHDVLFQERIDDLRGLLRRRLRLALFGAVAVAVLNAGVIGLLVWFVSSGRLGLPEAGAAVTAILLFSQRLTVFAGSAGSLYESSLFIEDFSGFVEMIASLPEESSGADVPEAFELIEVDRVSFRYPSRSESVVDDVSFVIRRGEMVALVGANGSGKTTLAKLLAGLYAPASGVIRWDGRDLTEFDARQAREQIGVIFQDYAKYLLSARENVSLGRAGVSSTDDDVLLAARKASADELLVGLRKGLDTQLGAQYFGGTDLSIGQWQRVAMARAFFRDAPFLILDEPTASLDAQSEADLFESLRELYAGRTVLVISHRFSTVRSADRIVVLDAGRVVEQGTHDQLMSRRGLYERLFNLQADAYLGGSDDGA